MQDPFSEPPSSSYHGHVRSDRPIDSIEVKIANTTRDELLDAWSPLVRRFNEMQASPSVGVSLIWMLVQRAMPVGPGRWVAQMPTEDEFFALTGMKRSSHHKARTMLMATGLARWSKLGRPWLALFDNADVAADGEPEPQPQLFATADKPGEADTETSAGARNGSPGRARPGGCDFAEANAIATEQSSLRAPADERPPGRTGARAVADFTACSGSGQLI